MNDLNLNKTILGYLQEFGLNEKEIVIYVTLLKVGPSTIMDLARKTTIKRSTTHNNVEELIKKGLVSQTNYGERRMVIAEDPDKLKFLLEQRKWEVTKLEKNMDQIVSDIHQLVPKARENTQVEVKYYVGSKELRYVYDRILKSKKIYTFVNVDRIKDVFPEYIDIFSSALKSKGEIEMWEILEHHTRESDHEDDYGSKKYHYKYVPMGTSLYDTDITIFDDNIAFINIEKDNPSAVIIQSKPLTYALRNIHQLVWNLFK